MSSYLEADQELSRLARRAAGMRGGRRALILPGIMGSTLGRVRKGLPDDLKWFDPAEIALGGMTKLALPGGSRYRPLGVLRFAYERLRLVLRSVARPPPTGASTLPSASSTSSIRT